MYSGFAYVFVYVPMLKKILSPADYEPSSMMCMPVQVQREGCLTPTNIAVAVAFDKSPEKGGKYAQIHFALNMFFLYYCSILHAEVYTICWCGAVCVV